MQKITLDEVKASCRREYIAGNLLFQNWQGEYGYGGAATGGHPCAIGSALTPKSLREIGREHLHSTILATENWNEGGRIRAIIGYDTEEFLGLAAIQAAHDKLCKTDQKALVWKEQLAEFLSLIGEDQ